MRHDGPVFASGRVACGRLKMRRSDAFAMQLRQLRDGEVEIRIERKKATRNQQQNRFYWGVVLATLSEHTGYTADELHDICKAKFLPKRLAIADGNGEIVDEYVIGGNTSKLSVSEFSEYIRQIKTWAVEQLDVLIPELDAR